MTRPHCLPSVVRFTLLILAGCPPALWAAKPPARPMDPLLVSAERSADGILTSQDLDLFQVKSVADLTGLVPGLAIVTSDTRGYGDIISMRGSANTLFFSPPAVGMTVDDVPMGEVSSYPAGLLEFEQVKVLQGPQGTLYGRNGAAGMIDMTTPRPGSSQLAELTTELGTYDSWGARLRTGGPLGGGFAQTLQFYHLERDGFITNPTLGHATDDRSITGGLANLFWNPTSDSEWRLRVLAERADDGGQRLSLLDRGDPFTVESEIPGETVMERQQVSLHWTKEASWGRLKSITAWQYWQLDPSVTDLDLRDSPPGFGSSSTIRQDQHLWSQEIRWESPPEARPWSWRTGVFFMDQSSQGDATRAFPVPPTYSPYSERTVYQLDQWSPAAYGRISYDVDSRLTVLAGTRLEYVDVEIDRTKTSASPVIPPAYLPPPSQVRDELQAWYVSPEIGASYAMCDEARLHARSAIGVKPGGFSAFASQPEMAQFDDEQAWTNELGVELTWPDHHLMCSLTGYLNKIDDYQLNRPDTRSTDYFTVNAGEVTARGVELELRWHPLEQLTVQGAAGYVVSEFDDGPQAGNAVPFVPEFTGSLGVRYDLPQGWYVQSSVRMAGPTEFTETNEEPYRQGSYFCWDAEIGYAIDHFSVALYGRNLLDRGYYTFINPQITAGSPGDPQLFGVRATLAF